MGLIPTIPRGSATPAEVLGLLQSARAPLLSENKAINFQSLDSYDLFANKSTYLFCE